MTRKTKVYRLWQYDVLGNARDGFDVNDRSEVGTVTINVKGETFNKGTPNEFTTWEPTDRQLALACGKGLSFDNTGDGVIYIEKKSNGRPEGELVLGE
jgi:hypothetical protein